MSDPSQTSDPSRRIPEMQERLDDLQHEIDEAEDKAKGVLPEHEGDEETFIEGGTVASDEVDNTIVPPG